MLAEQEWHGLRASLEQMLIDYQRFLECLQRQRKALIDHRMDDLQNVLLELENLADSIFLMDSRRRMHMDILQEIMGVSTHRLLDLVRQAPEQEVAPWEKLGNDLQNIRKKIEQASKVNGALIESSRQILQTTMEAVVYAPKSKAAPTTKTYGANGQMKKSKPQVQRNLFNGRV